MLPANDSRNQIKTILYSCGIIYFGGLMHIKDFLKIKQSLNKKVRGDA